MPDASDAHELYREVLAMDARGNVVSECLGNGVSRQSWVDGRTNRVRGVTATQMMGGATVQSLSYTWDALGNLKSRSN